MHSLSRRCAAEAIGTFWLVLGGCGSAVLAAGYPELGIGFVGVALAFGLTVLTMAYAFGHVSGAHFNPAVTLGLAAAGRFPGRDVAPYWGAQVAGALLAALLLAYIAGGQASYVLSPETLAANGYGAHSPGGYSMGAALAAEFVLTAGFVVIILGATDTRGSAGFAPIPIGLALTLIHLISIPVTNTSVNPARSTGPALVAGGWAVDQLWLFWLAPLAGAIAGALVYRAAAGRDTA